MKTPDKVISRKVNFVEIINKVISLKVNFWKMLFFLIFAFSIAYNIKQKKIIEYYEGEYVYFDSVATMQIREMDSLKTIFKSMEANEVVFKYITNNMAKKDQLLYQNPIKFAEMYLNGNQRSQGGGK